MKSTERRLRPPFLFAPTEPGSYWSVLPASFQGAGSAGAQSRFTGSLKDPAPYDYATVENPATGSHVGGVVRKFHDDGTATILLGGIMHVRGKIISEVRREK